MLVFLIGYLGPDIIRQKAEKSSKLAVRICRLQKFEKKHGTCVTKNLPKIFLLKFFVSIPKNFVDGHFRASGVQNFQASKNQSS